MSPAPDYWLEHTLAAIISGTLAVYGLIAWARYACRRHASRRAYRPSPYFRTAAPLHGMRGWQVGRAYTKHCKRN